METRTDLFTFDPELPAQIEKVSLEFHGQLDDLLKLIGLLVMGQLYGWRVMRLICPLSTWSLAIKLFGDPKLLMPERRSPFSEKSYGLKLVDDGLRYWDVAKRIAKIPKHQLSATVPQIL